MKNFVLLFIVLLCTVLLSAEWSIDQVISVGTDNSFFGHSLFISEDFAVVSSYSNNVFIYHNTNEQWVQEQVIEISGEVSYNEKPLFMNGNYLIIGNNYGFNNDSGSASIYHYDNESWQEMSVLTASETPNHDQYGCSVSISQSGEYAAVGASYDSETAENAGAVYIYHRSDTEWLQQMKLMAYDGDINNNFGWSTYISDDFLFVSSPCDDENGQDSGSIYIYENNGTDWVFHSKLTASINTSSDKFGYSMSVSDNYLIAGTYSYGQGMAFIFNYDGENWVQEAILTASDGFGYDLFGCSVSISGENAIIGASDAPDVCCSASAYFFNRQDDQWIEQDKLSDADWNGFGSAVSISGSKAMIGAEYDNAAGDHMGSVSMVSFTPTSSDPDEITNLICNKISNFPNPFNPTTTISFTLQSDCSIDLSIYNPKGQKIKTLAHENCLKGAHSLIWDGNDNYENPVSSGIYLYKLIVNDQSVIMNKCLMLK